MAKKKDRGESVNLDSFLDIMTCLVGVLVLIIILTGVDASQIKMLVPTPMRTPTDKRPVVMECRNNQIFPIPVDQLDELTGERLRELAHTVKGDTNKLMELLATSNVETEFYTVDLTYALIAQYALRPKPNVQGWELGDIKNVTQEHPFGKVLAEINPDEQYLTLLVRDDSFEVFTKARRLAWVSKSSLRVSYELLDKRDPIKFGLGGSASLAQ